MSKTSTPAVTAFLHFREGPFNLKMISSMPDEKRTDPFKPIPPSIPGVQPSVEADARVNRAPALTDGSATASRLLIWVVAAALAVCLGGGAFFLWQRGSSLQADRPTVQPTPTAPPAAAEAPKPAANLPIGPGPIATTEELTKAWAGKRFLFRDPLTSEPVPAMIVRLPDGSYWAFSLREPFGTCELDYVTELGKLSTDYNFRATHPMIVNSCTHTVYDLLRYGSSSDGGLVRGEVVEGTGIRPPMAIEVRVEGKQLVTARME
jgi:hypothetical protein